jgi:hypothetical protein
MGTSYRGHERPLENPAKTLSFGVAGLTGGGESRIAAPARREPGRDGRALRSLCPPLTGNHHIDLPAAALRTDQPLAPIEHWHFGAIPSSHLGGVGLDLMLAFLAPNDQRDSGSTTERHRCAGVGFHD